MLLDRQVVYTQASGPEVNMLCRLSWFENQVGENKGSDCSKIKNKQKKILKKCCNCVACWKCNELRIVEDLSVSTLPVNFALKGTVGSFLFLVLRKHLVRTMFFPYQEITSMYRSWEMYFSVTSVHTKAFMERIVFVR